MTEKQEYPAEYAFPGTPEYVAHQAAIAALIAGHPWQFRGLPKHGFTVGPGWLPEVEAVCADVDALLSEPRDRALFKWLQIKEKFGGLRMYGHFGLPLKLECTDCTKEAVLEALSLLIPAEYFARDDDAARIGLPQGLRDRIQARIAMAAERCAKICEKCGQPGSLIEDGWIRVRCGKC